MYTGSTGYRATAFAATRALSTSGISSASPFACAQLKLKLRGSVAERYSSTSAALFRWIWSARGRAVAVGARSDDHTDVNAKESLSRLRPARHIQRTGRHCPEPALGTEDNSCATERETGSGRGQGHRRDLRIRQVRKTGGLILQERTMHANVNEYSRQLQSCSDSSPSSGFGSGFESRVFSTTSAPSSSLHPLPHQRQAQAQVQAASQTPQTQADSEFQTQYSTSSLRGESLPRWFNREADGSPMEMDFSPPVGQEQEGETREGQYGVHTPAFMPGYNGMQIPMRMSPERPWSTPLPRSGLPPPYAARNSHPSSHPFSMMHPHTDTYARQHYPYYPSEGVMQFSSTAHHYTHHRHDGQGQTVAPKQSFISSLAPLPIQMFPPPPKTTSYPSKRRFTPSQLLAGRAHGQGSASSQRAIRAAEPSRPVQVQKGHQQKPQENKAEKKKKKATENVKLPLYSYLDRCPKSKILYVRDTVGADKAIDALRAALQTDPVHDKTIGFDLEWKPRFKKGEPENRVALVQLASRDLIVLAQVSAMNQFPKKLKELLEDSSVYKAGVSISYDSRKLSRDHGVSMHSCIELSFFAKCVDRQKWKGRFGQMIGLSNLVQVYLLNSVRKGSAQTSNWELKLNHQQQTYAANDAHSGLMVFHSLLAIAKEMESDRLPDPSYYSFDVIGQKVLNVNGDKWVPYSPHSENTDDADSLHGEEHDTPSASDPEIDSEHVVPSVRGCTAILT